MKTVKNVSKLLGELETQVMQILWQANEPLAVSDVLKVLERKRSIAYTTVQTIMTRLGDKGILTRKLQGTSYLYQPKVNREKFIGSSVHNIFTTAVSKLGQEVVLHFAKEIKNVSPKKRDELIKMLKKE